MSGFQRATKKRARCRMAIIGPSGSGKTYTALTIASHLGQRVALIDTERGSASKYAGQFAFDVLELETFDPRVYVQGIRDAGGAGYDVLVIDSLSHAWAGKDGALEQVDKAKARTQSGNSFAAWRDVTPMHNALVDAILQCPCHVIATMRAKTEYVLETDGRGRQVPRKVGMAPVQRDGVEYEFDVVADMDLDHNLIVSKTRCPALDAAVVNKPGEDVARMLVAWLTDGTETPAPKPPATTNTNGNTHPARQAPEVRREQVAQDAPQVHASADAQRVATAEDEPGSKEPDAPQICCTPACGKPLTNGQYQYSVQTFGLALCPECQRMVKAAQG